MVHQRSDLHLTGEEPTLCLDGSSRWLADTRLRGQEGQRDSLMPRLVDNTVYHTGSTSVRFVGEIVRA